MSFQKFDHPKSLKFIIIIFALLLVLASVVFLSRQLGEVRGNTASNLVNGGMAAESEG